MKVACFSLSIPLRRSSLSSACRRSPLALEGLLAALISLDVAIEDDAVEDAVLQLFAEISEERIVVHGYLPAEAALKRSYLHSDLLREHREVNVALLHIHALTGRPEKDDCVRKRLFGKPCD